jgi:hypothetical protein
MIETLIQYPGHKFYFLERKVKFMAALGIIKAFAGRVFNPSIVFLENCQAACPKAGT